MVEILRRTSIRTRLLAIALLPGLGVAWMAVERAGQHVGEVRQAASLEGAVRAAVVLGDLLHELQRERGLTSLHLSSKRARFGEELAGQRARTDERIAALKALVAGAAEPVAPALAEVAAASSAIAGLRARVASPDVEPRQLIAAYTEHNARLLAAVAALSPSRARLEDARQLAAYQALLEAKERTGLLRAQLANVFTVDHFAAGQLVAVASLMARRDGYLEAFLAGARGEAQAQGRALAEDPGMRAVHDLERKALDHAEGGFGVDPAQWFRTVTAVIDRLKEVELSQARQLEAAAQSEAARARSSLLAWLVVGSLLILATLILVTTVVRGITGPLAEVAGAAEAIARGHLDVRVAYQGGDELGALAASFRELAAYVEEATSVVESLAAGDLTTSFQARGGQDVLGGALVRMVDQLRTLVEELQATGGRLGGSSEAMGGISRDLDQRAARTLQEVNQVAEASTQLQACIAEIARSAAQAAELAVRAAGEARASVGTIDHLATSSAGIEKSLELINSLGAQTNTLALNATIEAARAGAAGKGFAVVAHEVKELARLSLSAAGEIGSSVQAMGSDTTRSMAAIASVGARIDEVNAAATTIAASVEEQAITARQIGESMRATLDGATATRSAAAQASGTARDLAGMADQMASLVARFRLAGVALPAAPARPRLAA